LVLPFVLQVVGAVGLVGYLSFKNGQRAVNDLSDRLMDKSSNLVAERLDNYLETPQKLRQFISEVQRSLKAVHRILHKEFDSQEIFEVYG
jgi:hypothetical protein